MVNYTKKTTKIFNIKQKLGYVLEIKNIANEFSLRMYLAVIR